MLFLLTFITTRPLFGREDQVAVGSFEEECSELHSDPDFMGKICPKGSTFNINAPKCSKCSNGQFDLFSGVE